MVSNELWAPEGVFGDESDFALSRAKSRYGIILFWKIPGQTRRRRLILAADLLCR